MTKEEYRRLFASALERSLENADNVLGFSVSRETLIILFDKKYKGETIDFEAALDSLYLGDETSYYVIDIGVKEIYPKFIKIFVRVSGHTPVQYDAVWTSPDGDILFKQVFPQMKVSKEP
jgi:hypothetical protein